jgi:cation diffusion facilitator family transporter
MPMHLLKSVSFMLLPVVAHIHSHDTHSHHSHSGSEDTEVQQDYSHIHERKTKMVIYLATITMVLEIFFGYYTNSMALLADGWHMSSHVFVLGLAWVAYFICRKYSKSNKYTFSKKKIYALSGFTSAVVLQVVGLLVAVEAVERLINPLPIRFGDAIIVAFIGLVVNGISAIFLHHPHEHGDHNIRAAYLHVLADGLTSLTAIIALLAGMFYQIYSLDAISGIISFFVITKWAVDLIRASGGELIEFTSKPQHTGSE